MSDAVKNYADVLKTNGGTGGNILHRRGTWLLSDRHWRKLLHEMKCVGADEIINAITDANVKQEPEIIGFEYKITECIFI